MELSKELIELIDKNKGKGFVAESEVALVFDINSEDYEDVIEAFKEEGVDIIPNDEMVDLDPEDEDIDLDDEEGPKLKDIAEFDEEKLLSIEVIASNLKTDDPVKMYLMDIGKVPLLTKEEECELAIAVSEGRVAQEKLDKFHNCEIDLSDKEEAKYERQIEVAQRAKDKLISSNLKLVVSIAKNYEGKGMQFLDLIQEGNIGLMKAVDKFEYEMGYKFSTYAHWWIRQAITRAVADQARTIRIPVHMVETINRLLRVQRQLVQDLSREPSVEEIAEKMKISPDKVQMILKIAQEPISLEKPVGEEDDSSLGDFVADPNGLDPYEYTSNALLKREIDNALNELSERERRVIRLRYGLEDGKCHTLEEVGKEFGVTRERIRQIESKSIKKLRHPARSKKLQGFIGRDED